MLLHARVAVYKSNRDWWAVMVSLSMDGLSWLRMEPRFCINRAAAEDLARKLSSEYTVFQTEPDTHDFRATGLVEA
jgi:hypothetical protein